MSNTGVKADWAEPAVPAPIILAIDTSSPDASLAVSSAENIIATLIVRNNRPHSQTLFAQISALLQLAEIEIRDVNAFAVATGPGSFTGLRVGLAAVKGLADSLGKPCLGANSLDLLALASGLDGAHLALINAGRGEVYCGFREVASAEIVVGSIDDQVGQPSSVLPVMAQYLGRSTLIITGDGGYKYKDEVFNFVNELQKASVGSSAACQTIFLKPGLNTSAALAKRATCLIKKNQIPPANPRYIRKSDAEIKWKS